MISSSSYFSFFEAKFECGRIIYWFFDKWVAFRQFLIQESLEGSKEPSWFCCYILNGLG